MTIKITITNDNQLIGEFTLCEEMADYFVGGGTIETRFGGYKAGKDKKMQECYFSRHTDKISFQDLIEKDTNGLLTRFHEVKPQRNDDRSYKLFMPSVIVLCGDPQFAQQLRDYAQKAIMAVDKIVIEEDGK